MDPNLQDSYQDIDGDGVEQSLHPRIIPSTPTTIANGNKKTQKKSGKKKVTTIDRFLAHISFCFIR